MEPLFLQRDNLESLLKHKLCVININSEVLRLSITENGIIRQMLIDGLWENLESNTEYYEFDGRLTPIRPNDLMDVYNTFLNDCVEGFKKEVEANFIRLESGQFNRYIEIVDIFLERCFLTIEENYNQIKLSDSSLIQEIDNLDKRMVFQSLQNLFEKLIIESNKYYLKSFKLWILKYNPSIKKVELEIYDYFLVPNKLIFLNALKNEFKFERGREIKVLIEVLIELNILKSLDRDFRSFFKVFSKFMERNLGSYQSVNDFKDSKAVAYKVKWNLISYKVESILHRVELK